MLTSRNAVFGQLKYPKASQLRPCQLDGGIKLYPFSTLFLKLLADPVGMVSYPRVLRMNNAVLSEILSLERSKADTSGVGLDHANNLTNLPDVKRKSSYHATDANPSKYRIHELLG